MNLTMVLRDYFIMPAPDGKYAPLTAAQIRSVNRVLLELSETAVPIQVDRWGDDKELYRFRMHMIKDEIFFLNAKDFLERAGLDSADWCLMTRA